MTGKAYLAVDLGAESGRAMVGVVDAGKITLHELHRFEHLPRRMPGGLYWDLTGLWGQIQEGMRHAADWSREHGVALESMGVDTWGLDWAVVGRSGELMGLPHCYRDERSQPAFEKVVGALGQEAIYDATGIQFMPINTLYQLAACHEAEPKLLDSAATLLFMPDLFHFLLTGRAVVELSIASTSQMYDPRRGTWAESMLQQIGLPTHLLGPVVPPGTRVGAVLPHVAADTGVAEDLAVIAPAGHDTACAVAAVPATESDAWAYLSSGTWSLMGAELSEPVINDHARQAPFTNELGVQGTVRFLKNISGLWLLQQCRRQFERAGRPLDYPQMMQLAAEAEPFRVLVDPDHPPFAVPGEIQEKISAFARASGQPVPEGPGQFVRCCLESLALMYRHVLVRLEAVLDRRFDVLHVVGGGGKNTLLNQMTADAVGRRVVVGPHEATATGNVLVQAMGAGQIANLEQLRQVVAASFDLETYEPNQPHDWDRAYERFHGLLS